MRRSALWLAVLPACSFDLGLPPERQIAFADAFPSAAPRETLALEVTGGSPPLRFAFKEGGRGSGDDALVDPGTGAYTAGSVGPAIDVVVVTDAAGAKAEARISVGPPFTVAVTSAFVAPGGQAVFLASGGKAPYQLVKAPALPGQVNGVTYLAPSTAACTDPVLQPAQVPLKIHDATAAPAVDLVVSVGRGLDLFPAAGTGTMAPRETLAFVASGGAPPYQFSIVSSPSGSPGIDAGRGTFTAGATGGVTDRIAVTDANGQRRCADVGIGPALALAPSTLDIRPGKAMRVVATGGRAPYAFSFWTDGQGVEKGNRSRAALDALTGDYVPGSNAGATDRIMVSDATGGPPVGPLDLKVGITQVAAGQTPRCLLTDVDGDGRADVVLPPSSSSSATTMRVARSIRTQFPVVQTVPFPFGTQWTVPVDLDGDGRGDLVSSTIVGSASATNLGGVQFLRGGPDGVTPAAFVEAGPLVGSFNIAAARTTVTSPAARTFTRVLVTRDRKTCASTANAGVAQIDWLPGASGPSAPVCAFTLASQVSPVAAVWLADVTGDGVADFADFSAAAVRIRAGVADGTWSATDTTVGVPAGWNLTFSLDTSRPSFARLRPAGAAADDLLALVQDANGLRGLLVVKGVTLVATVTPLQTSGAFPANAFSVIPPTGAAGAAIATWNELDGTVDLFAYPPVASPATPLSPGLSTRSTIVDCVAGGDVDGDKVPDLIVTNFQLPASEVILGDGDGGYGRRPHFTAPASAASRVGDVDLDGRPDIVRVTPQLGLETMFWSDGQLAVFPEQPFGVAPLLIRVADATGDGAPDVVAVASGGGVYVAEGVPGRPGAFALPEAVPLTGLGAGRVLNDLRPGCAASAPGVLCGYATDPAAYHAVIVALDAAGKGQAFESGAVDVNQVFTVPAWADLDGDGLEDATLVAYTPDGSDALLQTSRTSLSGASTWQLGAWTPVPGGALGGGLTFADSAGTTKGAGTKRRLVYFAYTGVPEEFLLVLVSDAGATKIPLLANYGASNFPTRGFVADFDGDGRDDVVLADRRGVLRFHAGLADGTFSGTPYLTWIGLGTLSAALPGTGGKSDLLFVSGEQYLIAKNKGDGTF